MAPRRRGGTCAVRCCRRLRRETRLPIGMLSLLQRGERWDLVALRAYFLVVVSIVLQFVGVLVVRGKAECDAAFSFFGGDVAVVGCLLFDLARRRGEKGVIVRC